MIEEAVRIQCAWRSNRARLTARIRRRLREILKAKNNLQALRVRPLSAAAPSQSAMQSRDLHALSSSSATAVAYVLPSFSKVPTPTENLIRQSATTIWRRWVCFKQRREFLAYYIQKMATREREERRAAFAAMKKSLIAPLPAPAPPADSGSVTDTGESSTLRDVISASLITPEAAAHVEAAAIASRALQFSPYKPRSSVAADAEPEQTHVVLGTLCCGQFLVNSVETLVALSIDLADIGACSMCCAAACVCLVPFVSVLLCCHHVCACKWQMQKRA